MRRWKKALLIILAFIVAYAGVMVVAYDYLYKYPNGYLDTMEREDDALFYKVVYKEKIDKKTLLYFARSNNGVGGQVHVGTLDSSVPNIIANFFCESTSSYYLPANTICYGLTDNAAHFCYLFGTTTDENTVKVTVTFTKSENEVMSYDMKYDKQCFYYVGFDSSWADYPCRVTGYNKNDGITFTYKGTPISVGQYTPEK